MESTNVADKSDPTGAGMFSHSGRFTSYQYTIFKRKEEILSSKEKKYRPPLIPFGNVGSTEPIKEEEDKIDANLLAKQSSQKQNLLKQEKKTSREVAFEQKAYKLLSKRPTQQIVAYVPRVGTIVQKNNWK